MRALIPGWRPVPPSLEALDAPRLRLSAEVVLAVAVLGVALVLRLAMLGTRDVFRDEAASWLLASYPWADILPRMSAEPYPPLYPFLLKGWMTLFGDGTAALRAPTALAGIGVVALTWTWARAAIGRAEALVAAGIVALAPLALTEAREIRMYALETLFATVAWWSIWRWLVANPARRAAWTAVTALAVAAELWTMPTGPVAVSLQVAVIGIAALRRSPGAGPAALGTGIGIGLYLPWLPRQLAAAAAAHTFWTPPPSLASIPESLLTLLAGWVASPATWLVPVLVALGVAGVVRLFRRPGQPARDTATIVLAGMGLIGAWWLLSFVRPVYDARYFGAALPFLAMAIGTGAIVAWGRLRHAAGGPVALVAGVAAVALFASGTLAFGASWLSGADIAPARAVVVELERQMRPGDIVVAADARSYFPVAYESERGARAATLPGPLWYWRSGREPVFFGGDLIAPARTIAAGSERDGELAIPGLAPGGSIWLVALTNGTHELDGFGPYAAHEVQLAGVTTVTGTNWRVPIYRLRAPASPR